MNVMKISFSKEDVSSSSDKPTTKFGGQPDWITVPQWPISKTTGKPMEFICQIAIDKELFAKSQGGMAYIFFASDETEDALPTNYWEFEGGDNAIIIQPQGEIFPYAEVQQLSSGPSASPETHFNMTRFDEPDLDPLSDDQDEWQQAAEHLSGTKIGGKPYFIQYEEYPIDEEINLLLVQIECEELKMLSSGIIYVFINEQGTKGRFLYQR